ncbi:MAG: helix-turn-helix domain-containing protein, partial [Magnetococcus sp. DMHC-8]
MNIFKRGDRARINREAATHDDLFDETGVAVIREESGQTAPLTATQVGACLRQARERQGLSIGEMSRRTRIRDVYLHAL